MATLIAKNVVYFSPGDEHAFFSWLKNIGTVHEIRGVGHELLIETKSDQLPEADLRELVALFHRYGVERRQLAQFVSAQNAAWFRDDPRAYWHADTFGHE